MSWFKVDDTAHTHPKLRGAGTAAIGLWTLGGSYAAQYLTDGVMHEAFVKTNGTAPQIARLVKAKLWHPAGHDCDRCVQPGAGAYVMHDYLVYNPSRTRVLAERKKAADKKRGQRGGEGSDGGGPSGIPPRIEEESKRNLPRIEEESSSKASPDSDETSGQLDLSLGDTFGPRAGAARPDPVLPSKEGSTEAGMQREPAAYDTLRDLKRAASAAGLQAVAWDLTLSQVEQARQAVEEVGITAMVDHALASVRAFGGLPRGASAWIKGWTSLEAAPPGSGLSGLAGSNVVAIADHRAQPLAGGDIRYAEHLSVIAQLRAMEDQ